MKTLYLIPLFYLSLINSLQSQPLQSSPIPPNSTPGKVRGDCVLIPLITENSTTHLPNPTIWIYVIPPKPDKLSESQTPPKTTSVQIFSLAPDGITPMIQEQSLEGYIPSFIKFQLPIQQKQIPIQQKVLEFNQPYELSITCQGTGDASSIIINRIPNINQTHKNVLWNQQVAEFTKLNLWAEAINPLFTKDICQDREAANRLFNDIILNKLRIDRETDGIIFAFKTHLKKTCGSTALPRATN